MIIPDDIRNTMYQYVKNYDIWCFKSYLAKVTCERLLAMANKDDMVVKLKHMGDKEVTALLSIITNPKKEEGHGA